MLSGISILLYGTPQACRDAAMCLRDMGHAGECTCVDSWGDVQAQLMQRAPGLIVILMPGAAGMEGVYLARKLRPGIPVFWFSDDRNFGVQSHRLECAYFSLHPLTREKLMSAFRRCTHVGVRFPAGEGRL